MSVHCKILFYTFTSFLVFNHPLIPMQEDGDDIPTFLKRKASGDQRTQEKVKSLRNSIRDIVNKLDIPKHQQTVEFIIKYVKHSKTEGIVSEVQAAEEKRKLNHLNSALINKIDSILGIEEEELNLTAVYEDDGDTEPSDEPNLGTLSKFPLEILLDIFARLPIRDKVSIATLSSDFNRLMCEERGPLNTLYKEFEDTAVRIKNICQVIGGINIDSSQEMPDVMVDVARQFLNTDPHKLAVIAQKLQGKVSWINAKIKNIDEFVTNLQFNAHMILIEGLLQIFKNCQPTPAAQTLVYKALIDAFKNASTTLNTLKKEKNYDTERLGIFQQVIDLAKTQCTKFKGLSDTARNMLVEGRTTEDVMRETGLTKHQVQLRQNLVRNARKMVAENRTTAEIMRETAVTNISTLKQFLIKASIMLAKGKDPSEIMNETGITEEEIILIE